MHKASPLKNRQTLKELTSQLQKHEGELNGMRAELNSKKTEVNAKEKVINNLKQKIKELNINKAPTVSEHALLRYLERVHGIDMQKVRDEILNEKTLKLIDTLGGTGEYPSTDNCVLVMKDNVVITIKT